MEGAGNGVGPFGVGFAFSMHGGCLKVVHCHVGLFEGSLLDLCLNPLTLVFLNWADSSLLFGHLCPLLAPLPRSRFSWCLSLFALSLTDLLQLG